MKINYISLGFTLLTFLFLAACTQPQQDSQINDPPQATPSLNPGEGQTGVGKDGTIIPVVNEAREKDDYLDKTNEDDPMDKKMEETKEDDTEQIVQDNLPLYMTHEFKDINTQTTFIVNQFKGKSILLEVFAVWCPLCTKQQQQIKLLHEEVGDDIVSIAINADANEDEAAVQQHLDATGFDWYYAISPKEVTQNLVAEFSTQIINPPSVPVILICPDQTAQLLDSGVKSAAELQDYVAEECA